MHAGAFGIKKREGLAKTFFTRDWMHSILQNKKASKSQENFAKSLLKCEIGASTMALMISQGGNVSWLNT